MNRFFLPVTLYCSLLHYPAAQERLCGPAVNRRLFLLARYRVNVAVLTQPVAASSSEKRSTRRGQGLQVVEKGCRDIGEDDQRRLSVHLANCQLAASGLPTYKCTRDMTIKACTKGMTDQAWNSYTSMLMHTGTPTPVCLLRR